MAFGTSIAVGIGFELLVLEASARGRFSDVWGEGIGENDFSEKDVVDEDGDVFPPQPKKEPSFDPLGDLGCDFWMVVLEPFDSLLKVRDIPLGELRLCGGVGLLENMDILEREWLAELESLYHGPIDSEPDVRAESWVNLACFAKGYSVGVV